jgi:DNA replication and repair protein RecF
MTLMQVTSRYSTARSRFDRVLTQRNSLLKRIREGAATADELEFWDDQLATDGAVILHSRASAVTEMAEMATEVHAGLAPGERLEVEYLPRLEPARELAALAEDEVKELYARVLKSGVGRDTAAGMTLQGPHRDDLGLRLDDLAAAGFASRAQQRTIALSLRLAETRFLRDHRGESPVLLLDDVLSEMDAARRRSVLASLGQIEQMMVTGTELDRFPEEFAAEASLIAVRGGSTQPLVADPPGARASD